jgi:predicted component of type VI protein secretion system
MAFLTVRVKGVEGYTRHTLGKDRTVVGRASACDVAVPTNNLSREHCLIIKRDDGWYVEDLNSSNGTFVGSERIAAPRKLAEKDIIKAGAARLTFHAGDAQDATAIEVDLHKGAAPAESDEAPQADGLAAAKSCPSCGLWVSTAHRRRGESLPCPRCQSPVGVG